MNTTGSLSSARPPARKLAGLLFEFVFPGQRHPSFPLVADSLPLSRQALYKDDQKIVNKFRKEYEGAWFSEYVSRGQFTSSLKEHEDTTTSSSSDDDDVLMMPRDVDFERILSELRKCTGVIPWLRTNHAHTDWSMASPTVGLAAREWILANDLRRRRALLETANSGDDPLTQAIVAMHGKDDWETSIQRCLRNLKQMCRQPFQISDEDYHKYYKGRSRFNLTRSTAKYHTRLLDLDLNHKKYEKERRAFEAWKEVDVERIPWDYHNDRRPRNSKRNVFRRESSRERRL